MKSSLIVLVTLAGATLVGGWPKDFPEEEPIQISGVLSTKVFPGPPNYENVAQGDRREEAWLLISETVSPDSKEKSEAYQLVVSGDLEKTFATLRRLRGQRITVEGKLWVAHTGHHHTRYLITPTVIKEEPSKAPKS